VEELLVEVLVAGFVFLFKVLVVRLIRRVLPLQ
jgi:hypothetical protein